MKTPQHLLIIYGLSLLLLLIPSISSAQSGDASCLFDRKEFVQDRRNFFAKELNLTPEESDHLDRVLQDLDKKKLPLWRALREQQTALDRDQITEEEAASYIEMRTKTQAQISQLNREALTELQKVIPAKKLINFHRVQHKFAQRFINKRDKSRRR